MTDVSWSKGPGLSTRPTAPQGRLCPVDRALRERNGGFEGFQDSAFDVAEDWGRSDEGDAVGRAEKTRVSDADAAEGERYVDDVEGGDAFPGNPCVSVRGVAVCNVLVEADDENEADVDDGSYDRGRFRQRPLIRESRRLGGRPLS